MIAGIAPETFGKWAVAKIFLVIRAETLPERAGPVLLTGAKGSPQS